MNHDQEHEDKAVRVAVALSRAVALSDELQATVLELAETLRQSDSSIDTNYPRREKHEK
jgi:hypothetical protein